MAVLCLALLQSSLKYCFQVSALCPVSSFQQELGCTPLKRLTHEPSLIACQPKLLCLVGVCNDSNAEWGSCLFYGLPVCSVALSALSSMPLAVVSQFQYLNIVHYS